MTRKSKEQAIFQKISAIRVLHKYGIDEALRGYPDQRQFIEDNKHRSQDDVMKELENQLYKKKKGS